MKENESLGVHLLCGSRQSDRTYLKEEVVNPTGDFKRVEQKMAQIEGFVHVERISNVDGTDFVTGKSHSGI
ncbi:hypothetical protein HW35_16195 [Bacillus sp. X1(2014)]|nr:hypothetical protein HW35_16195 [Bacillus sp. X1(2014)]